MRTTFRLSMSFWPASCVHPRLPKQIKPTVPTKSHQRRKQRRLLRNNFKGSNSKMVMRRQPTLKLCMRAMRAAVPLISSRDERQTSRWTSTLSRCRTGSVPSCKPELTGSRKRLGRVATRSRSSVWLTMTANSDAKGNRHPCSPRRHCSELRSKVTRKPSTRQPLTTHPLLKKKKITTTLVRWRKSMSVTE